MDTKIDEKFIFKNFNMVTELDIAGEFIYDGIHTLNQMYSIEETALLFSFLYHISVGIERMQKIIIVLFEDVPAEKQEEFEKSLITHSHGELAKRIAKFTNKKMNSRENEFLQILSNFYNSARYGRFNIGSQLLREQEMIQKYIKKNVPIEKIQYNFFTNELIISDGVKEILGRVIGSISKFYYNLVKEGSDKNNTYTYELRPCSKAEKIFLANNSKKSLQKTKIEETIALKELLIYLRNTKEKNSFVRFLDEIEPLELDVGLLNEYIAELSKGIISQSLIDEVNFLHEENGDIKNRIDILDAIGNTSVLFDMTDIDDKDQIEEVK